MPLINHDDVHAMIDEKIRDHETAILSLKRTRNAHLHISQLPDEVLSMIFRQVKFDYDYESDDSDDNMPTFNLGWVKISAVCHHWRQVSLDTLCLWTDINFTFRDLDYIEELLRRSKTAPLYLTLSFPCDCHDHKDIGRQWDIALATVSKKNIQHLCLYVDDDSGSITKLLKTCGHGAAHLKSLSVGGLDYIAPAIDLPLDMPALQFLMILGTPLPDTFPVLPNLTELTLEPPPDSPLSVSSTVSILRNTPLIRSVVIKEIYREPEPAFRPKLVELPRLEILQLTFHSLESLRILSYLSIPATSTHVDIGLGILDTERSGSNGISHIQPLWSRIAASLGSDRHVSISLTSHSLVSIVLEKSNPDENAAEFALTTTLDFPLSILAPLFDTPTSLELGNLGYPHLLCSSLPSFINVETFRLTAYNLSILEVITTPFGSEDIILPKLKTLTLSGYVFGDREKDDRFLQATDSAPFSALLGSRRIENLKISDSTISRDFVNQFWNRNIDIDWDNSEILEYPCDRSCSQVDGRYNSDSDNYDHEA